MNFVESYKVRAVGAIETVDWTRIEQAIEWFREARDQDRRIFVCGNGGSASTASHFATDILKGCSAGKLKRFRITALTESISTITAYANDASYDSIFIEQLKNLAEQGDVVLAISCSGNSPNVVAALRYANSINCRTIALTGRDGGKLGPLGQIHINVPEPHMGRIEDAHLIICHMIAYYFMEQEG